MDAVHLQRSGIFYGRFSLSCLSVADRMGF